MSFDLMKRSALLLCVLGLSAVSTAQAQLNWTFSAGVAYPAGAFADYFDLGATVGVEVAHPLQDRLALVVGGDFDHYNGHSFYGLPNVNLWRGQVGLRADLLGGGSQSWAVEGNARVGGASLRSQREFYSEASTFGTDLVAHSFAKTSLTGSAGLRLRFGGESRLNGVVGASAFWANLGEKSTEVLRLTEPQTLKPLKAATGYSLNLGFSWR
jgi:hypothetical protein